MARNRTIGCIRCPWCPRQFWVEQRHGSRAMGVAVQQAGRHALKVHGKRLEDAYAALKERASG